MNNVLKKILAVFLGCIVFFVLIELTLQTIEPIYNKSFLSKSERPPKDSYVILCVGNSFTAGSGAPIGQGYPEQLQVKLTKLYPKKKIVVINRGVPGNNSYQLRNRLKANLDFFKPNLLILRAGGPNEWNHQGIDKFLLKDSTSKVTHFIKIFKFFDYMKQLYFTHLHSFRYDFISQLSTEIDSFRDSKATAQLSEKEKHNLFSRYRDSKYFESLVNKNVSNKVATDLAMLKHLTSEDSHYSIPIAYLYQHYYKDDLAAFKWFMWGSYKFGNTPFHHFQPENISSIRNIYAEYEKNNIFRTVFDEFALRMKKTRPEVYYELHEREDSTIKQWVESDINHMIRLAKDTGTHVVVHNYPPPPNSEKSMKNHFLNLIAAKLNVPYVDHESIFNSYFKRNDTQKHKFYYQEWGKVDTHLNEHGYELMANNLVKLIVARNFINLTR